MPPANASTDAVRREAAASKNAAKVNARMNSARAGFTLMNDDYHG
jgi:hypothetical protein